MSTHGQHRQILMPEPHRAPYLASCTNAGAINPVDIHQDEIKSLAGEKIEYIIWLLDCHDDMTAGLENSL